jgi:hypothetical protein
MYKVVVKIHALCMQDERVEAGLKRIGCTLALLSGYQHRERQEDA